MSNKTVISTARENGYDISDEDVRSMCRTIVASDKVNTTLTDSYFRVLVRRTQKALSAMEQSNTESALKALDEADDTLYPLVKEAALTEDVTPDASDSATTANEKALERNRRTNYARSAKSVLKRAITQGVDILAVDVNEASKGKIKVLGDEAGGESAKKDDLAGAISAMASFDTKVRKLITAKRDADVKTALDSMERLVTALTALRCLASA